MIRPDQLFVEIHTKTTGGIDAVDWVTEELNWSGSQDTFTDLTEEHRGTLTDVGGDPQFS